MLLVNLQLEVTIQALMLLQLTVRGNTSTGFTYCELLLDVLAGDLVHAVDDGSLCGCPHAISQCTYVWQNTCFDDLHTTDILPSSDLSVLLTTVIITIINRFIFSGCTCTGLPQTQKLRSHQLRIQSYQRFFKK